MQKHQILLFYKYIEIEDPNLEMARQRAVCEVLGLTGRLIVAHEGINGTLEGTLENTEKYMNWMKSDKRFKNIHWKLSVGTGEAFPKLSVKVRKEIVSLHLDGPSTSLGASHKDINPNIITGTHLPPHELRKWYDQGKEFYIVDMRNDYELKVGKFENTVFPGMENFRDLKDKVKELDNLKDKTVLTVCTGGVRCEKASGLLKQEGFKDVYQLDGGIVSYMQKYPGKDFKGSLYVFDKRITMHFEDTESHQVIGKCERCDSPSEQYANCAHMTCHKHFIICESCLEKEQRPFCSEKCRDEMREKQKISTA